jgi:hypothetical protein
MGCRDQKAEERKRRDGAPNVPTWPCPMAALPPQAPPHGITSSTRPRLLWFHHLQSRSGSAELSTRGPWGHFSNRSPLSPFTISLDCSAPPGTLACLVDGPSVSPPGCPTGDFWARHKARHSGAPVIPATWEAEIGRVAVRLQPGQVVHETPSPR